MGNQLVARRHNSDSARIFVATVAERSSSTEYPNPKAALKMFRSNAALNLSDLRSLGSSLKKALKKVEKRKQIGELDKYSAHAEAAAPKLVLQLTDTLHSLYKKAKENKDIQTLTRVSTASESLLGATEGNLLDETYYAANDPQLYASQVVDNVVRARQVLSSVTRALHGAHEKYGIVLPANPTIPGF
jgi:hypothetical protein